MLYLLTIEILNLLIVIFDVIFLNIQKTFAASFIPLESAAQAVIYIFRGRYFTTTIYRASYCLRLYVLSYWNIFLF